MLSWDNDNIDRRISCFINSSGSWLAQGLSAPNGGEVTPKVLAGSQCPCGPHLHLTFTSAGSLPSDLWQHKNQAKWKVKIAIIFYSMKESGLLSHWISQFSWHASSLCLFWHYPWLKSYFFFELVDSLKAEDGQHYFISTSDIGYFAS